MLKFSFGMPKKLVRRLDSMPSITALQELLTQSIEDSTKEVGIAWTHNDVPFRLFVKHHDGDLLWRLFHGAGLGSQHSWSSEEANLRNLYGSLLAECNDLSGGGRPETIKMDSNSSLLGESVISRNRGKLEEGTLDQLMRAPLPIKRTYLATTEPIAVKALIERVGLPVEEVIGALKELLAAGLLSVIEEQPDNSNKAGPVDYQFASNVRNKLSQFEIEWGKALATPFDIRHSPEDSARMEQTRINQATSSMMQALQQAVKFHAEVFNNHAVDQELHIIVTDLGEVTDRLPKPGGPGYTEQRLQRWRASTPLWSLSARARPQLIEIFIVSAADAMSLGTAEHELQFITCFQLSTTGNDLEWLCDELPVSADDVRSIVRTCIRQLIAATISEMQSEDVGSLLTHTESTVPLHSKQSAMEKQNLAQKIVSQQEEIQRRIARDLHDAVIADVTLLKRTIASNLPIERETVASALEQIAARLREICYDLSPSDLKDWGLQTTIEDLLDQVSQRTGSRCHLECSIDIPPLESSTELHIFRIVQEALNNSAKYSGASEVLVAVRINSGWLQFGVIDNGRGFESSENQGRHKSGGMGMSSMQERVQLIRTLYPARLQIVSQPGTGTTTTLSIKLPRMVSAEK